MLPCWSCINELGLILTTYIILFKANGVSPGMFIDVPEMYRIPIITHLNIRNEASDALLTGRTSNASGTISREQSRLVFLTNLLVGLPGVTRTRKFF